MATIEEEDGFWKEVVDAFFEDFMALFFPEAHAGIDWEAGFLFRDKELPKLELDDEEGPRIVDKLVEVQLLSGDSRLILVHVEVQSNRDPDFTRRMFVYHYRLRAKHELPVANFAVFADLDPAWRPNRFEEETLGTHVHLSYSTVKLLDFRAEEEELSTSDNLFAVLVLAVLKAQETSGKTEQDMLERADWKLRTVRSLYERRVPRAKIRRLLKFVDWIVRLPEDLGNQVFVELEKIEKVNNMAYVTSFERIGIKRGMEKGMKMGLEKGLEQGLEQGRLASSRENIIDVLESRFGTVTDSVRDTIQGLSDIDHCKKLLREAVRASSMEDFEAKLEDHL